MLAWPGARCAFLSHPRFPSPLFSRRPKQTYVLMIGCVHSSATKRFYTFFSFCLRAREFFTHLKNFATTVSSKQRRFQLEKKKYVGHTLKIVEKRKSTTTTAIRKNNLRSFISFNIGTIFLLETYLCCAFPLYMSHPPKNNKKKPS